MNGQIQYDPASALTSAPTSAASQEVFRDVAETQAELDATELAGRIVREGLPVLAPRNPLPPGEQCHFVAPVRCGRRRTDEFGHLELTSHRVRFHGAIDVNTPWAEVAGVERIERDIVISLRDTRRQLRFCCHVPDEAVRGAVIARHLALRADLPQSTC